MGDNFVRGERKLLSVFQCIARAFAEGGAIGTRRPAQMGKAAGVDQLGDAVVAGARQQALAQQRKAPAVHGLGQRFAAMGLERCLQRARRAAAMPGEGGKVERLVDMGVDMLQGGGDAPRWCRL